MKINLNYIQKYESISVRQKISVNAAGRRILGDRAHSAEEATRRNGCHGNARRRANRSD